MDTATRSRPQTAPDSSSVLARTALRLTAWTERWVPDAFIFALLGTVIVVLAAIFWTASSLGQVVDAWGRGFWELIRAVCTDIRHFPARVVVTAVDHLRSADARNVRGVERRQRTAHDHRHDNNGPPSAALRPPASGSRPNVGGRPSARTSGFSLDGWGGQQPRYPPFFVRNEFLRMTGVSMCQISSGLGPRPCVQQRARRHGIAGIHGKRRHCGICKLQILKGPVGFESHPLRQNKCFTIK